MPPCACGRRFAGGHFFLLADPQDAGDPGQRARVDRALLLGPAEMAERDPLRGAPHQHAELDLAGLVATPRPGRAGARCCAARRSACHRHAGSAGSRRGRARSRRRCRRRSPGTRCPPRGRPAGNPAASNACSRSIWPRLRQRIRRTGGAGRRPLVDQADELGHRGGGGLEDLRDAFRAGPARLALLGGPLALVERRGVQPGALRQTGGGEAVTLGEKIDTPPDRLVRQHHRSAFPQ